MWTDRQADRQRQTDKQTGAYAAVLPLEYSAVLVVGFPSPCPASETPPASAPPHLRDTCDGSPSAERERERKRREGEGRSEGEGGEGYKRKNQIKCPNLLQLAVELCNSSGPLSAAISFCQDCEGVRGVRGYVCGIYCEAK